jgi:hypothetical protein
MLFGTQISIFLSLNSVVCQSKSTYQNFNQSKFVAHYTHTGPLFCCYCTHILYVDSLEAPSLHIPDIRPRVAAWSRKLLDKLMSLDTNQDGSFGKLKVFGQQHQPSFL